MPRFDEQGIYKIIYDMPIPDDANDVILVCSQNYKVIFHNCSTGKSSKNVEEVVTDNSHLFLRGKSGYRKQIEYGFFSYYYEPLDVFVLKLAQFDVSIPYDDIRKWEELEEENLRGLCFVFDRSKECYVSRETSNYTLTSLFHHLIDVYFDADIKQWDTFSSFPSRNTLSQKTYNGITNYYGHLYCCAGQEFFSIRDSRSLGMMINIVPPKKLSVQKKWDSIMNMSLKPISQNQKRKMFRVFHKLTKAMLDCYSSFFTHNLFGDVDFHKHDSTSSFSIIEKVNDNVSVIRVFVIGINPIFISHITTPSQLKFKHVFFYEIARIYVKSDKFIICTQQNKEWILNKKDISEHFLASFMIDSDDLSESKSVLHFMQDMIDDCLEKTNSFLEDSFSRNKLDDAKNAYMTLFRCLEYPVFESLRKSEYQHVIEAFVDKLYYVDSVKCSFTELFGSYDLTQKSLPKALGITSFMLKELDNRLANKNDNCSKLLTEDCLASIIATIKHIFASCPDYFHRMNNVLFSSIIDHLVSLSKKYSDEHSNFSRYFMWNKVINCLHVLVKIHGPEKIISYIDAVNTVLNDSNIYWIEYCDYLTMAEQMKDKLEEIPYQFSHEDEGLLLQYHHLVTMLYNTRNDEKENARYENRFKELNKKWMNFLYTDDEYSIIAPCSYMDVANEGLVLRHCVKSYIEAIVAEETTVLFIRKNNDLKTPFFTLEIRDNEIRQCHGFGNCNTDTVEGLEGFLKKYCNAKGFVYTEGRSLLGV